ncbi:phosphatidylglycerophosphatase A [Betaproteobacteria bacterium]|nr:phosphatidylglycerophosphatase A [Betaproteobacteria bacterium]
MKTIVSYSIATGFGSGYAKFMPGTIGTIWAWIMFLILDYLFGDIVLFVIILTAFIVGIVTSGFVENHLKKKDASEIVIDEIVAFWLILFFLPRWDESLSTVQVVNYGYLFIQIQAFVIFRFFDILKPWPTNIIDKKVRGGLGIMLDDIVAAFQTLFVLSIFFQFGLNQNLLAYEKFL